MPIWLIVFLGLQALPLLDGPTLWLGVDRTAKSNGLRQNPQPEYLAWAAPREHLWPREPGKPCDEQRVFAFATRGEVSRFVVNGEEQLIDTAWSRGFRLADGQFWRVEVNFLRPVGGAVAAQQTMVLSCGWTNEADRRWAKQVEG